jgi:hypothetical protein
VKLGSKNSNLNWDVSLLEFPHDQVLTVNSKFLFYFRKLIFSDWTKWTAFHFRSDDCQFRNRFGSNSSRKRIQITRIYENYGTLRNKRFFHFFTPKDSAYWVSWFITMTFWMTSTVFILIISGCIFQFNFFLKNNFGLYFLLLWLFSMTLVSLAFLTSTLVKKVF